MRKPRNLIAVTVLMAVAMLLLMTVPAFAGTLSLPKVIGPDIVTPEGPEWVDGTYMQGAREKMVRQLAAQYGTANLAAHLPAQLKALQTPSMTAASIGDTFDVTVADMGTNTEYVEHFVVVAVGTHGIICIPNYAYASYASEADGYYHFPNPFGTGYSEDEPWQRTEDLLSPAQLTYLLGQFDTTIWNKMSTVFGTPNARGAEGQKVWILIHNIRDEMYYNTPGVESYVAGYFSSSEDLLNTKNMMHIDTYDWVDRTGAGSARPYLYEGIFAHEYQHLLHFDMDPDEESWIDEGLADHAAFLCGFMKDNGHVLYYLAYHPYTALTFFGGNLFDYGSAYLFQLYLWEKFGGDKFTTALFHDQANGIAGVQNELNKYAGRLKFDYVYDSWTIANYLDMPQPSPYGYRSIDIGGADTNYRDIEYYLQHWYNWTGGPLTLPLSTTGWDYFYWPGGFESPPQPYTAHYYSFEPNKTIRATLDGDDLAGVPAYSGDLEWCSGAGAYAWRSFYDQFAIPAGGAWLKFWTYYEIEQDWDYGYVEIHDHNTGEWTTLKGFADDLSTVLTTDTLPQKQDNPNVPAGREPKDYFGDGTGTDWNAFTGYADGWTHVNMDLTPFAGHTITIYFRTWQDPAYTEQMMYVDDISIPELSFFDDMESGSQWTTPAAGDTAPWSIGTGLVANDWQGTLLTINKYGTEPVSGFADGWRHLPGQTKVLSVKSTPMHASTQSGTLIYKSNYLTPQIYIVSNRADHILRSNYSVSFQK